MKFSLYRGLPYINVELWHNNQSCLFERVLVDTGSATSIFCSDLLGEIDVKPDDSDKLHRMQGVGGYEYVIEKIIDAIVCDNAKVLNYPIQLGELDYGQGIQAIIGSDILNHMDAIIDYKNQTVTFNHEYDTLQKSP